MSDRILILGGTKEAAELAQELQDAGHSPVTSLAGRTKEPKQVVGDMRIGGFGGVEKMASWIKENDIAKVIDATHPFAEQISINAVAACKLANVPLEVRRRGPWTKHPDDIWIEVDNLDEAAQRIPQNAQVLLALGSQHLKSFRARKDVRYLVRMVDPPQSPLQLHQVEIINTLPAKDWRSEAELLKNHAVTHIVCRNSGGTGAYAKIEAARRLAIPVIIVKMST